MALKSNILLRQRSSKMKLKKQSLANKENESAKNEMVTIQVDESILKNDDNEEVDFIQSTEQDDPDNTVEYLTVILENDELTESGDDTVEMIEELTEGESVHTEDYVLSDEKDDYVSSLDEIPKMSLKKHRTRRRNKDDKDHRSLTCEECGKTLSNSSSYRYHMQLHSEETPFLCSHCGEGFKTKNSYDGHIVTHDDKNPNKCNICGKMYRQAASLRSHLLTHTGEKVIYKGVTEIVCRFYFK